MNDEDIDPGEPIQELRALEHTPRPGFLVRVRQRVQRRALTHQVIALSWEGPRLVVVEFFRFVFQFFDVKRADKGDRK